MLPIHRHDSTKLSQIKLLIIYYSLKLLQKAPTTILLVVSTLIYLYIYILVKLKGLIMITIIILTPTQDFTIPNDNKQCVLRENTVKTSNLGSRHLFNMLLDFPFLEWERSGLWGVLTRGEHAYNTKFQQNL